MKLTAKLALSQLKINKRRTTWTFCGIVLSTAMLTTIYGLGYGSGMSWIDTLIAQSDFRNEYLAIVNGIAVVLSIFVIAISIIVISNAFRVSASERMTQFGILKSVGATKKQIRQTVVYEGLYLTVIAIPVGILIGFVFQLISIHLINYVIEPMLTVEEQEAGGYLMEFVLSWIGLLLAVGVSLLTVFLSAWLPAKKASLIPAINAIRGEGEVKIKNKKVRGGRVVQKIFKTEGMLARTFLKRSKRNFRATVIAISFSVAIFIMAGSFYSQMSRFAAAQWRMVEADAILAMELPTSEEVDCEDFDENAPGASWSSWGEDENGELINQICYMPIDGNARTVLEFNEIHERLVDVLDEGDRLFGIASEGWRTRRIIELPSTALTSEYKRFLEDSWVGGAKKDYYEIDVELIVVDDTFAVELAELAGVEKGSNILVNYGRGWFSDNRVTEFELLNFAYQTLSISLLDNESGEIKPDEEMVLELQGQLTLQTRHPQLEGDPWNIRVIVPQENLEGVMRMEWLARAENSTRFVEEGEALLFDYFDEGGINVFRWDLNAEEMSTRNIMGLVMFFMFSFVGVLILIGLTNVVSTISENVRTRSKEFAVLQSVGMTGGGINQMLNLESVFSSIHALMIGVPLGIAGSYGIFLALENAAGFSFNIPWIWMFSAVVAVFITTWTTMHYAARKLKKQNIIETIRSGSGM